MTDAAIPVQPASPQAASAPLGVKVFTVPAGDGSSTLVMVQAMALVNELGRPVTPMSEETGQDLLQAIKELTALMASTFGGLMPSTRGMTPPTP